MGEGIRIKGGSNKGEKRGEKKKTHVSREGNTGGGEPKRGGAGGGKSTKTPFRKFGGVCSGDIPPRPPPNRDLRRTIRDSGISERHLSVPLKFTPERKNPPLLVRFLSSSTLPVEQTKCQEIFFFSLSSRKSRARIRTRLRIIFSSWEKKKKIVKLCDFSPDVRIVFKESNI